MSYPQVIIAALAAALGSVGCASHPPVSAQHRFGADPDLPPPQSSWLPTVDTAPAEGWTDGEMPAAAVGFRVEAYALGLDHPRWLVVLPTRGATVGLPGSGAPSLVAVGEDQVRLHA